MVTESGIVFPVVYAATQNSRQQDLPNFLPEVKLMKQKNGLEVCMYGMRSIMYTDTELEQAITKTAEWALKSPCNGLDSAYAGNAEVQDISYLRNKSIIWLPLGSDKSEILHIPVRTKIKNEQASLGWFLTPSLKDLYRIGSSDGNYLTSCCNSPINIMIARKATEEELELEPYETTKEQNVFAHKLEFEKSEIIKMLLNAKIRAYGADELDGNSVLKGYLKIYDEYGNYYSVYEQEQNLYLIYLRQNLDFSLGRDSEEIKRSEYHKKEDRKLWRKMKEVAIDLPYANKMKAVLGMEF